MLSGLTSRQMQEWMAFFTLEPFGSRREDMRFGMVAATVHAMQRGKASQPRGPEDFFPIPSPQEQKAVTAQRLKGALAGRRRKKKG